MLRFPSVALSRWSYDSLTSQGGRANVERPVEAGAAGHLQDTASLSNER
jgi:hypothetical protein